MNNSSPTHTTASSLPARKITRKELAAHCGFCTRTIDELTRCSVLPHYKIGKSVRYDLAEVEATLRQRFYVGASEQPPANLPANLPPPLTPTPPPFPDQGGRGRVGGRERAEEGHGAQSSTDGNGNRTSTTQPSA